MASGASHFEMLEKLQEKRISPLFRLALMKGEEPAIVLHLRRGAPLDGVDNHGCTPLMIAARLGREDLCDLLIAEGADPSAIQQNGACAADIAESEGWVDLAIRLRSMALAAPIDAFSAVADILHSEETDPGAWVAEESFETPASVGCKDEALKNLQATISSHRHHQLDDEWQLANLALPTTSDVVTATLVPPSMLRLFEASLSSGVTTRRRVILSSSGYKGLELRALFALLSGAGIRMIKESTYVDFYDSGTEIFRNSASARELAEDLHSLMHTGSDAAESYIARISNSRVFNAEREARLFARLRQARDELLNCARGLNLASTVSSSTVYGDRPDAALVEDPDLEDEEGLFAEEDDSAQSSDEMLLDRAFKKLDLLGGDVSSREYRELRKRVDAYLRAREIALEGGLKLVPWVARRYKKSGVPLEDLIQEGNVGLIRAVDKFDPQNGARFGTYAVWWIRQAITRSISEKLPLIRIPVHLAVHIGRFNRFTERFQAEFNRTPGEEEVSAGINVTIAQARRLLTLPQITSRAVDQNALRHSVDETQDLVIANELRSVAGRLLATLTAREERVLRMRFGFFDEIERTLEEIGQAFDVTRERIRQIEAKALRKLKHPSRSRFLRSYIVP